MVRVVYRVVVVRHLLRGTIPLNGLGVASVTTCDHRTLTLLPRSSSACTGSLVAKALGTPPAQRLSGSITKIWMSLNTACGGVVKRYGIAHE